MRRLRAWWATRKYGEMTRDWCEVCHIPLRMKQRVEVSDVMDGTDDPDFRWGGSSVSATYCIEHAPEEALT